MAVPDTFRLILLAVAAMVAYRFTQDLSASGTEEKTGQPPSPSPPASAAKAAQPSAEAKSAKSMAAPRSVGDTGKEGRGHHHKLKKNQVLIEYCTS